MYFKRLTLGVQHLLDGAADTGSFSQDDELKSITGYKCYILARGLVLTGARHGCSLAVAFWGEGLERRDELTSIQISEICQPKASGNQCGQKYSLPTTLSQAGMSN